MDDKTLTGELEQYHNGYMHAIYDVRKIKLRSRDVTIHKKGGDSAGDGAVPKGGLNPDHPSSSHTSPREENDKQKGPISPINMVKERSNVKRVEPMAHVKSIRAFLAFDL